MVWIRVGALGDLLVSLRALETSLERFPNAQFWIIGSKLWIEILDPRVWPRIDGILVTDKSERGNFYLPEGDKWTVQARGMDTQELYRQADAAVNLRIESYRFAWGPLRALVPTRIGSCPPAMRWFYTHHFPWLGKEPAIHERDWYDGVARAQKGMSVKEIKLGELARSGLPRLTLEDPKRSELLWNLKSKSFAIVNPTSSRKEKAWPAERYARLVRELNKKIPTVVVGAPKETEWLKAVAEGGARIIQPESLRDLFDLVGAAKFIVCNTSSLQFVAAAQGTKAMVLMGLATPLRWGPLGPDDVAIEAPLKLVDPKINLFERERQAYESIPFEMVNEALKPWL